MHSLRLLRRLANGPRAAAAGQIRQYALVKPPAVPAPSAAAPGGSSTSTGRGAKVVLEYKPRTEVRESVAKQAVDTAAAAAKKPSTNLPAVIDERLPWSLQPLEARKKIYKKAAGRWTRGMVAMPIFIMSSYWLYDRLIVGTPKKEFPENWRRPPGESTETEAEGEKTAGSAAAV